MSALAAVLIIAGIAILVVAIWMIVARVERARSEAMQRAAEGIGFLFDGVGDLDRIRSLGDLPLFNHGHSKRLKNLMTGRSGEREMLIFDFRYTVGGGKESHTYSQTVAFFPRVAHNLPDLTLSPENIFHRIGHAFGYQDINFESNAAFSSCYLLRGPDETAIRSTFGDDVLSYFEHQVGWTVEVQGGTVGIYRSAKRVKPEDVSTFREETQAVVRALTRR